MWGIELVVMLAMIVVNGLFAGYEIALASVSLSRLQTLVDERRRGAKAAVAMKRGMERSLAVVQLGITMVGAIAAATGGAGAKEAIAPGLRETFGFSASVSEALAITLVVLPLTVLTIIFGELIPKVFSLRNKEFVCLQLSPTMRGFSLIVWPVVWFLDSTVKVVIRFGERLWTGKIETDSASESAELRELKESVALARTSLVIGAQQEKIIMEAATLSRRPVGEIMLPAEFISTLDIHETVLDALVTAHLDMHTRFPTTEIPDDPQSIVGYVNFKDIVAYVHFKPDEPSLRAIMRQISSFRVDTPISRCLERLIRERSHIAIVRGLDGSVVGMVTMEDMIEELVGEIEDEFDRLPAHIVSTGKGWIVGGGAPLTALQERTALDLVGDGEAAEEAPRTISDWLVANVDGPIEGGEVIRRPTARIVVRKTRRNRVMEVFVSQVETADQTTQRVGSDG